MFSFVVFHSLSKAGVEARAALDRACAGAVTFERTVVPLSVTANSGAGNKCTGEIRIRSFMRGKLAVGAIIGRERLMVASGQNKTIRTPSKQEISR